MVTQYRPKPQLARSDDFERLYNQEAEVAVLGSMLLDDRLFPAVAMIVNATDFFMPRHQYIYQAMYKLSEADTVIDTLTVAAKLAEMDKLKDSGGDAYLAHLMTNIPSSQHVEHYAKIVQRLSARRMMLKLAEAIRTHALTEEIDTNELISRVTELVDETAEKIASTDVVPIGSYVGRVLTEIEEAMNGNKNQSIVSTGIQALDELLGGYKRQMVYLVGGRTHNGKSSLAYNAMLADAKAGKKVAFYNTADGDESTIVRILLAIMTGISTHEFQMGISDAQYLKVIKAAGDLAKLPIFIKSDTSLTPRKLYAHARVIRLKYGLDVIYVDYLQAMQAKPGMPAYERNTYIAEMMPIIAKKLNVPIVAMAQINRAGAGGKAPGLLHVEGSGKYEQACHVGIIVHYDNMYDKNAPKDRVSIIVEKNKATGRKGMVYAKFNPHTTQLGNWEEPRDISNFVGDYDDD